MIFVASDILALLLYEFAVPLLVRVLCALVDLRGDRGVVVEAAAFSDIIVEANWSCDCVCVAMFACLLYAQLSALRIRKQYSEKKGIRSNRRRRRTACDCGAISCYCMVVSNLETSKCM